MFLLVVFGLVLLQGAWSFYLAYRLNKAEKELAWWHETLGGN